MQQTQSKKFAYLALLMIVLQFGLGWILPSWQGHTVELISHWIYGLFVLLCVGFSITSLVKKEPTYAGYLLILFEIGISLLLFYPLA